MISFSDSVVLIFSSISIGMGDNDDGVIEYDWDFNCGVGDKVELLELESDITLFISKGDVEVVFVFGVSTGVISE